MPKPRSEMKRSVTELMVSSERMLWYSQQKIDDNYFVLPVGVSAVLYKQRHAIQCFRAASNMQWG